jgi:hypothetical protein
MHLLGAAECVVTSCVFANIKIILQKAESRHFQSYFASLTHVRYGSHILYHGYDTFCALCNLYATNLPLFIHDLNMFASGLHITIVKTMLQVKF